MAKERYPLLEAAEKLGVSKATLFNWINRAGWREIVDSQIDEVDRRIHYLTRDQLEKLAKDHRRKITQPEPESTTGPTPLPIPTTNELLLRLTPIVLDMLRIIVLQPATLSFEDRVLYGRMRSLVKMLGKEMGLDVNAYLQQFSREKPVQDYLRELEEKGLLLSPEEY